MVYLFVVQFYAMLCVTSRQHTPIHASSESVRLLTLPTIRVYIWIWVCNIYCTLWRKVQVEGRKEWLIPILKQKLIKLFKYYFIRAGNLLIWFPSESLVYCPNMSNSLTIAHFLGATWANRSWSLIFGEWPEQFDHIAHFWWATWAIRSHHS